MMHARLARLAVGGAAACLVGGLLAVFAAAGPAYAQDSSSTASTPASASIVLGNSNSDTAVVTGDATFGSPTGTVTFYECGPTASPTACTSQSNEVGTGPVGLTAGASNTSSATSVSFTPTSTGYWCFAGLLLGGLQLRTERRFDDHRRVLRRNGGTFIDHEHARLGEHRPRQQQQ